MHRVQCTGNTRDSVKQATSVTATMTALVLGLLISNGLQSFQRQSSSVGAIAVNVSRLDEVLKNYGDQAQPARALLQKMSEPVLYSLWERPGEWDLAAEQRLENEEFAKAIADLPDVQSRQVLLRDDAYKIASTLVQERFALALMESIGLPRILLVTLIGWSFIVFAGVGFCSTESNISRIACYFAAAAASTAVFLVIEFDTPFSGAIQISREPVTLVNWVLGGP